MKMSVTGTGIRAAARAVQLFIVDSALTVLGLLCLIGGLYYIFVKDSAAMTATCMGAGLILLFASTLHRFELLKGFGIEAKMKKLDATIDKAEVALAQLKQLTEVTTTAIVQLTSKAGRFGGAPTVDEAYTIAQSAKTALQSVRSTDAVIRATLHPWVTIQCFDMARAAMKPFDEQTRSIRKDLQDQISALGVITPEKQAQHNELIARLRSVETPKESWGTRLQSRPLEMLTKRLTSAIDASPELTPQQRADLLDAARPFFDQIDYLVEHYDFKDIQFWRDHVVR